MKKYKTYSEYTDHQKEKTTDPIRRKKWLTDEWNSKLSGFKEIFSICMEKKALGPGNKALCIGARTGQEVQALLDLDVEAHGIDLVEHEPLVIKGDMHELPFKDEEFDFVFSNVFDHALYPEKKCSEIERVLKKSGHALLQFQIDIVQDEYTETFINDVSIDVVPLFNKSVPIFNDYVSRNFAGMNWELLLKKDNIISELTEKVGKISDTKVPDDYKNIWNKINLPIQKRKAANHHLTEQQKEECFEQLHKRAYYLTKIAKHYNAKNILEVGTAEGWQFYTFAKYVEECDGHVWSCDLRDVRNEEFVEKYRNCTTFHPGDSKSLSKIIKEKIDFFYVDGAHDKGSVLKDVLNLRSLQSENPVWVFNNFDTRFGCYHDLKAICKHVERFKIYHVGNTASGNPSHQVIIFGKL